MPKNYLPPNLHVLPRNMAHLYIYIHTIYTYDLPLISLLKMGFSHSKLFWFSVENLHWDVPEAVTGEPEELSHEAQAKPLR
jgi:hypothetical protein